MEESKIGELVRRAKGEDRSLREYARDAEVDAAIISKIISGTYIPKKPGIYEALTSPKASPRGGVTFQMLLEAAGTSEDYRSGMSAGMSAGILSTLSAIPSSVLIKVLQTRGVMINRDAVGETPTSQMKPEQVRRVMELRSQRQRFAATANGIILGSLGMKGLVFQVLQTEGAELDEIHFDTYVRLMNHEVSEYLIRYAFLSNEEAGNLALARNTLRRMTEELLFLTPVRERKVSIVTNHPEAYEDLCNFRGRISYDGELSVILFDLERAAILKEQYLSHYISDHPVGEILLI